MMLHEIFYWLLNMSITASITGTIVMLVRLIKAVPKRVSVFLWMIPFLRMILPLGLNSRWSLMSLISRITTKTVTVYRPTDKVAFSVTNCVMAADGYFPVTYKVNRLETIFGISSVIWITASFVILLTLTAVYFTTFNEFKDATHLYDNVYLSKKTVTPAVYGIFRPRIILPESFKLINTELVILHEKVHIQRADNLLRLITFVIAALHWFNPFSWLFLKLFLCDLEMSCDEIVLKKLDDKRKKEYALTLFEAGQERRAFFSGFGGARIGNRIKNILSFKRLTTFSIISFTVLILIIFYTLLTNAS